MLDVLVPVKGRPHNAEPFMRTLAASCDQRQVRVTVVVDAGDDHSASAWAAAGAHVAVCHRDPGSFSQKANIGYILTEHDIPTGQERPNPWLFLVGDDVAFHPGWLDNAMAHAEATGAQVVGTNDLGNGSVTAGLHATHMFIARSYVDTVGASWDGPGIVCHEGYRHCYVDDEIVHAAKQRGVWTPAMDSIVEHLHPGWGKSPHDDVYAMGGAAFQGDGQTFIHRRSVFA